MGTLFCVWVYIFLIWTVIISHSYFIYNYLSIYLKLNGLPCSTKDYVSTSTLKIHCTDNYWLLCHWCPINRSVLSSAITLGHNLLEALVDERYSIVIVWILAYGCFFTFDIQSLLFSNCTHEFSWILECPEKVCLSVSYIDLRFYVDYYSLTKKRYRYTGQLHVYTSAI